MKTTNCRLQDPHTISWHRYHCPLSPSAGTYGVALCWHMGSILAKTGNPVNLGIFVNRVVQHHRKQNQPAYWRMEFMRDSKLVLCSCFTQLREGEYVEFDRAGNVLDADMLIGRVRAAAVIGRVA